MARLLHDLVKKDKKWEWTEREEKVFKELKERFTKELVLAASDIDKKNEDGGRCVRLCNGRHVVNGMQRWIVKASSIFVQIVE